MLTPKSRSLTFLLFVALLLSIAFPQVTALAITTTGEKGCYAEFPSNNISIGQTIPVFIRNGTPPIKFAFDQGWETIKVEAVTPIQFNITGLRKAQGTGGGGIAQISFTDSKGIYCGRPWIQVITTQTHSIPINLTGYWVDRGTAQSQIIIMQEGSTLVAMETWHLSNVSKTWFGTGKIFDNRFSMEIYFSPEANSGVARKMNFTALIENNNSILLNGGNHWQRIW